MKQNTKDQFELMFEALGASDQQAPKNEEELKKIQWEMDLWHSAFLDLLLQIL